ncbi:phenylalanine--tRNA ligase subunit beta [Candidatus Falkowbacteria bacterium CG_4_10_14_0_2_um_filter_41_15]|uniref:Phenylalanine--tRNA ligase beta subunit n=4 Tax=Candidatus Falkowiibacteriota TaxID=1752728 RepID=A0A2G9ZPP8_9BACT|nr:MAG: phenylalanine--tRNA ligase subunit beta [Candidatus Falkowbacteria bacterium CG1_02_41_21]PIP34560.1 MAG: phenylalanine--tRNA ligase subunit beta [Candidatus Falkowbacteria bacterium CG23_combo_of_CG06-09_8_20_14_all_41_10]PJA08940.1 MAG: phenylalanine--tRNA ligase subunit beta [Candidatus Falkowbacteria bacterium CG_4_10_14_0_2_um_filter_41_15]
MLLSLNWLKDHVAIPKNISPEDLAQKLTLHTVEVEKTESQAERFNQVVLAKILTIRKHPNADRLQVATVDAGQKEELSIVCGAPNIAVGQIVPLALPGAVLPNGIEIKEAKMRGEKSQGMLCAEDELGLGHNHDGIMVLPKGKPGQSFASYLKLDDIIIEVDNKSLSNRPDLWGHYGIAREISVILNTKLKALDFSQVKLSLPANKKSEGLKPLDIKVENYNLCPRYMAIKLDNIEIKESPAWLQARLIAVGSKPINNIVDITNYVMLELGQPLHAFDAQDITKIVVRSAKKNETIKTLDDKDRKLEDGQLLITDGQKALAIAGIMGGADSAISATTKSIIIESANFDAAAIRQGSTKLGLRTDASMRYEKALDPNLAENALKMAVELIQKDNKKVTLGSELSDLHQGFKSIPAIELDLGWLNNLVGQAIPVEKTKEILTNLGFVLTPTGKNKNGDETMSVKVPSWRATKDIAIKEDLAEEVMRLYGYNNVSGKLPEVSMEAPEKNEEIALEHKIRNILVKESKLTEVYNYSFTGEEELKKLNLDDANYIKLVNPISKQHTLLRQNLLPGLINNIRTNQYRYDDLGLFEIGGVFLNVFGNLKKNSQSEERLPYQEKQIGIALAGSKNELFSEIKSIVADLIYSLISPQIEASFVPTDMPIGYSDKELKAAINVLGKNIGTIVKVDENITKGNGLKKIVVMAELSFNELLKLVQNYGYKQYRAVPKYPPMVRDLAFVVDAKILYNDIRDALKNFHELITSVELFDVYVGDKLGANKKNLAFHVIYQSDERTLTTEEIDTIQNNLINHLQSKFEAQIRNF